MRIIRYKTQLNDDKRAVLLKESSNNYPGMSGSLNSPEQFYELCNGFLNLSRQTEEYVYLFTLDIKFNLIGLFEVSHGTNNLSYCNPREIFRNALLCNATYIAIVHNHPSGDATPSKSDRESYERIVEAGQLIGCSCIDSIIIGDGNYYSFHESEGRFLR